MTVHEYYQRHGGKRKKPLRDKIDFPKNTAVELALAYSTGKEGENGNGAFYTYTTTDDRIFFATPVLNQKIQALGPQVGEPLEIELRNNRATGGKNLWDVRRSFTPQPQPQAVATMPKPAPAPEPAPLPVNGSGDSMLDICMKSAIDVCVRGQRYAASKSLTLVFSGEDIRTIMNTLMIGMQKGAR